MVDEHISIHFSLLNFNNRLYMFSYLNKLAGVLEYLEKYHLRYKQHTKITATDIEEEDKNRMEDKSEKGEI